MGVRYFTVLPALLLWAATDSWPAFAQAPSTAEQDQIAEAVVEYAYQHDVLYLRPNALPYLSLRGTDPTPEFLARVSAAIGITLYPGSAMTVPLNQMRNSIVISVSRFTVTQPNIAQGSISAFCGPTSGGQMRVTLKKRDGDWEVQAIAAGAVL